MLVQVNIKIYTTNIQLLMLMKYLLVGVKNFLSLWELKKKYYYIEI